MLFRSRHRCPQAAQAPDRPNGCVEFSPVLQVVGVLNHPRPIPLVKSPSGGILLRTMYRDGKHRIYLEFCRRRTCSPHTRSLHHAGIFFYIIILCASFLDCGPLSMQAESKLTDTSPIAAAAAAASDLRRKPARDDARAGASCHTNPPRPASRSAHSSGAER